MSKWLPPLPTKKWGVISATLTLADGTGVPAAVSRAIRPDFGTVVKPKMGSNMAVFSTGNAADKNDANPAYASFQDGQATGTASGFPADWLLKNGNALPNTPGCPNIQGGATANDPVMLTLTIRAPTNVQSFTFNSYFSSAEGGTFHDYCRRVSQDVIIGRATRLGAPMSQYFILARAEGPA